MKKILTILPILMILIFTGCSKNENNAKSEKFKIAPLPVMESAIKNKKYLMVIFESEDCRYCAKLNKEVLSDLKVKEKLIKNKFDIAIVNVYGNRPVIDPENKNEMDEKILAYVYRVQGFPTIAIFDPTQDYKLLYKITGYLPKDNFINLLDYVGSTCYKKVPFDKYIEGNKTC